MENEEERERSRTVVRVRFFMGRGVLLDNVQQQRLLQVLKLCKYGEIPGFPFDDGLPGFGKVGVHFLIEQQN